LSIGWAQLQTFVAELELVSWKLEIEKNLPASKKQGYRVAVEPAIPPTLNPSSNLGDSLSQ
jgi:hypothetical protein